MLRLLLVALTALAAVPAPAVAGPSSARTAIVALGDSYISGEGGRWQGNSPNSAGDRDGTDRACVPRAPGVCDYDQGKVYVGGSDDDCHRSDVAEVLSADVPVDDRINIACSGAVADNIWRASRGGVPKSGEPPQADQLLTIARERAVKLIIVSVGGNDVGFASIVRACFEAYTTRTGPCRPSQQPRLDAAKAQAQADVEKAIDEVRAVMAQAGYRMGDFRLVLQTYPSVIPRAREARYPEQSPERSTFGCPLYDEDLDWGRDSAAPQIGGIVKAAARSRGTEVLELIDAFQGREICSVSTESAGPGNPPSATQSEWGRALSPSAIQQGERQELFHPNAYGQQALGVCVAGVYAGRPGTFTCTGTPGRAADGMRVTRTGDVPGGDVQDARPRCADASPADRATATPQGRGLRFRLPAAASGAYAVDVFQQSAGREVIGNRRVARFRGRRTAFTWSGRGARDGIYVVRFRTGADEGRVALTRSRGRFRARRDYAESPGCGVVRLFKLERPVLGGTRNRALGIAVKLDRPGSVAVSVHRAGRVLRRFRARDVPARRVVRFRLASERLPRGEVTVRLRVTTSAGTVTRTLGARRL